MVLWFNKTTEVHSTSMNSDLFSVLEYFLLLLTSNKSQNVYIQLCPKNSYIFYTEQLIHNIIFCSRCAVSVV